MSKCKWCIDGGAMERYHDEEWGIPLHNDRKQFEFLMLEAMQCGLSWSLMIKKRETLRKCFDDFDYTKIAEYNEEKIEEILSEPDMIKSRRKVEAVINNAKCFMKIIEEYGSFDKFIWDFSNYKTLVYPEHQYQPVASNELSDRVSKILKKRGFKYIGSITVYSHLQACGVINDHEAGCPMFKIINENYSIEIIE